MALFHAENGIPTAAAALQGKILNTDIFLKLLRIIAIATSDKELTWLGTKNALRKAKLAADGKNFASRWCKFSASRGCPMKSSKFSVFFLGGLFLLNANTAFAEAESYKCSPSHEIQQSLVDEELCSDLDITNKNKLSSCLQRKYLFVENELNSTYKKIIAGSERNNNIAIENKPENEVYYILSLIKNKPANLNSFIEDNKTGATEQDIRKKEELVKEQTVWSENLLYNCMEAANEVKNDPHPLFVIKGCLITKTEERLAYLNGLL